MSSKIAYERYADAPLVRGGKADFDSLRAKGWVINSDYMWSRRIKKTDPPYFTIDANVGGGNSNPSHGAKFWCFRTAAYALRFERGAFSGLGWFDTERMTAWQGGVYCGHYVMVGKRVMGTMHAVDPSFRDWRIFNVALVGVKGEHQFRLQVGSGSFAVPIDPPKPMKAEKEPVAVSKHTSPDRDMYIAGYKQGFRDAMELSGNVWNRSAEAAAKLQMPQMMEIINKHPKIRASKKGPVAPAAKAKTEAEADHSALDKQQKV